MSTSPVKTRRSRSVNRKMVQRKRPVLVPLIGERAFKYCVRTQYFVKFLAFPLVVGVGAVVGAAFTQAAVQIALAGIWGGCVLYCLVGFPVLLLWIRKSTRLASRKLSADLGYPIEIRGGRGRLDVDAWKWQIDRAMHRYRTAHPRVDRLR